MAQKQKNQGCLGGLLNAIAGLLSLLFKLLLNLIRLTYDILFAGFKFSQIQNKSGFVLFWTTAVAFCLIGGLLATGARSGINSSNATPIVATVEVTRLAQVEVTRLVERVVTVTPTYTPKFTPAITPTPTITSTPTRTPRFTQTPAKTPTPLAQYVPLLGKIWAGVKVYYGTGSEKAYGFEILGGSENCPSIPSGRGVKVRYPDGTEEWKDREYLVSSGLFFVLENDPAIPKLEWYVYSLCP